MKETIIKEIREKIDPMVGKVFNYAGNDHLIKSFSIIPERERVEIITNHKPFDRNFESIIDFLSMFKPTGAQVSRATNNVHTASDVHIYHTIEYAKFKMITGNRQLNENKIKRIIKDIEGGIDVLKYYPIQVVEADKKLEIIDGQHRFYIGRKLKRPIHYIILEKNIELPDIAKINSNTEKWKMNDFLNCYIQQGNTNYVQLQEFMDKYGFSGTTCIKLLSAANPGSEGEVRDQSFQRGSFEVKFLDDATKIADMIKRFDKFLFWKERGFVIAVFRIMKAEKVDMEELIEKFNQHPDRLTKQGGYKEYMQNLEMIFNIKKMVRIPIY